jgi:hypothetical protein
MDLHVVTSALRNYSSDLHVWSGDTAAATSYVSSNLDLTWSDGMMFQPVIQVNDNVVPAITDALARIKTVLEASGLELRAAAKMYDETDHGVAVDMDKKYEAVGPPGQRYADIASPSTDEVPEPPKGEPSSPTPTPVPSSGGGGGGGGGGSW